MVIDDGKEGNNSCKRRNENAKGNKKLVECKYKHNLRGEFFKGIVYTRNFLIPLGRKGRKKCVMGISGGGIIEGRA